MLVFVRNGAPMDKFMLAFELAKEDLGFECNDIYYKGEEVKIFDPRYGDGTQQHISVVCKCEQLKNFTIDFPRNVIDKSSVYSLANRIVTACVSERARRTEE